MIYWIGGRYKYFLIGSMNADNVVVNDTGRTYGNQIGDCDKLNGHFFLNRVAFLNKDHLRLVSVTYGKKTTLSKVTRERIYTEEDDIGKMPERVIVRTDDIDFIRQLFLNGKKVSWYDPDWNKYIDVFLKFDFDRLFIDLFKVRYRVILPTGEVVNEGAELGQYDIGVKFGMNVDSYKFKRKIGFRHQILLKTLDIHRYYAHFLRKGWRYPQRKRRFTNNQFIAYFNMLSLTYMLCQKSIAKTVRK